MRNLALVTIMITAVGMPPLAAKARGSVWARLEVVENTAEGPAFDRCQVEGTIERGQAIRWRAIYGEARADPGTGPGWSAIRSRSGCAQVDSERAPGPWILRGSPYLEVDVALKATLTSDRTVRLDAALTVRRLTGFAKDGTPTYETKPENRTLVVPEGGSAVIPVMVADEKEIDEFRVREVLFRFRANAAESRPPVEYGEIAVAADEPHAEILLDGGFVGRTSGEGPVSLGAVRAGQREVIVRDPSGREARTVVRVEKGHKASVSLALLPEPTATAPGAMRALGLNPQGGEEFWREKDAAIMVRIPGGEFRLGSPEGVGEIAEHPQHLVRLRSFLIDKTEVTWGQYRRFMAETKRGPPRPPVWGMLEAFPASNVTWEDARDFCTWAGGRLPTEAEWERAARGDDSRQYPWGNDWDPWRCNTRDGGPHAPTPAGAYPDCVSPYGVLDLAGSVWEWCTDRYDETYYQKSPEENPMGPETGSLRVSRGAAWMNPSVWARSAYRQGTDPGWPDPMRGFRCAQDDPTAPGTVMASRPASGPSAPVSRIEVRAETLANREGGPAEACEVVRVAHGAPFASWSTFGDVAQRKEGKGFALVRAASRCGAGAFPDASASSPAGTVSAPFEIVEVSATPGWDPGPMDPGPVPVVQLALTITSRQLTGFSPDGKPLYRDPVIERRTVRVGEGEEFVVPVLVAAAPERDLLGIREVFLRMRAGWVDRPGSTAYGALAVMAAAPGSEILLDGGVAGHAGADGSAVLAAVPVGERQVRTRGASGTGSSHFVSVVKGRSVIVSTEESPGGPSPRSPFVPSGKNAQGFAEFRRARDGAVMVRIPEGEYSMGNLETEGKPLPHTVSVLAFLMDKLPVTVGLFKRFAAATGRPLPPDPYWGVHDDSPVAFVRWDEGKAYCEWAGARLPTEAEREKAARGTDGRLWPWGSESPSPERGVFRRNWGQEGNDTVGIRPAGASPYGLLDTGGNMWEWCEDWFDADYYTSSPKQDPAGPRTGRARVVRGGSWDSRPTVLSASCRNFGYTGYREGDFGFRCAADPPHD